MGLIERGSQFGLNRKEDGLPPGPMPRGLSLEGTDEAGFPRIDTAMEGNVLVWGLVRWNQQRSLFSGNEPKVALKDLSTEQKTLIKDIRLAVAISNSLVEYLDEQHTADFDRWELSHHGHFHDRRIESWIWTLVSNRPEFFRGKNRKLIYSLALFARFHDFMQIEYQREGVIDSRTGHTSGSALALSAMEKRYAEIIEMVDDGEINPLAKEIVTTAALMTLIHGHNRMSDVLAVLTNGGGAIANELDDEALVKAFNDGRLDPLTLRFSDIVRLHRKLRGVEDGSFGLTNGFEEIFQAELRVIEGNNEPLYSLPDTEIRRSLRIGCDIAFIADDIDKLYPTKFSLWRKLLGAKADDRPLFRADSKAITKALAEISEGRSSYGEQEAFLYHDLGRNIYEYLLLARLMTESPYLYGDNADRTRHIFKEIILRSLYNFEAIGIRFLKKGQDLFLEIERELLEQLQRKVEARLNGVNGRLNGSGTFQKRYEEIKKNLKAEKKILLERLRGKKIIFSGDNPEADPESEFTVVVSEIRKLILSKYFGMSNEEIDEELGRNTSEATPFSTYYSIGSKDDMQRIVRRGSAAS